MLPGRRNSKAKSVQLLWLVPPLLIYIVPLVLGFGWNSLSGPSVPGPMPPEGYTGRLPAVPITAESWGTAVVIVPFHARLNDYLRNGYLPLWNPYQGLGQPFTAGGEGGPYFPLTIVRALAPYSWDNWINLIGFLLGGLATVALLRGFALTSRAAIFGGVAFMVSGALSVQIPRDNIVDQLWMIPVLLWATAAAVRERTARRCVILAIVSGLHLLAGFAQIALPAIVLVGLFALVYAYFEAPTRRDYANRAAVTIGALALGGALAAFSLLPVLATMANAQQPNQNMRMVYFDPQVSRGNAIAFFLPQLLGDPYSMSWAAPSVAAPENRATDWDNLFGYLGLTPLFLIIGGVSVRAWRSAEQRLMFRFFGLAGLTLFLRYLSVPPFDLLDLLPPFDIQTRKHTNGLTILLFILAAAIAVDHCDRWRPRWVWRLQLISVACLVVFSARLIANYAAPEYGNLRQQFMTIGVHHLAFSGILVLLVLVPFALVWRGRLSPEKLATLATTGVIGEAICYLPLGTNLASALYVRAGIAALIVVAGLLGVSRRRLLAVVPVGAAIVVYAWLVVTLPNGLPLRVDTDQPATYMRWLQQHAGSDYRTFGIYPDTSSIAGLQDLGVVGPIAPRDFQTMVYLTSAANVSQGYAGSPIYMMAGRLTFLMVDFEARRPLFNWLGVRYIVLEKAYFTPPARPDQDILTKDPTSYKVAYEDDRVRIVESLGATPKAQYWPAVSYAPDAAAIIGMLHDAPGRALGPPLVEEADRGRLGLPEAAEPPPPIPAHVDAYTPNQVTMTIDTPGPGLVVLKDVYAPGWSARVDGQPTELVRVNAMVRGVLVREAGHHQLVVSYWPLSMTAGLVLALAATLLIVVALVSAAWRHDRVIPAWALLAGLAIIVGGLVAFVMTVAPMH
jgi:hypothetical protein